MVAVITDYSLFSDYDIYLFKEGKHYSLYNKLGGHLINRDGKQGCYFAVWAPNAQSVSVFGDFNGWNPKLHYLKKRDDDSGIWEGSIEGIVKGMRYKYHIISKYNDYKANKGDPFAFMWEPISSDTVHGPACIVWDTDYNWKDNKYTDHRNKYNDLSAPLSIYELHIGSWKRNGNDEKKFLTYGQLTHELCNYIKDMKFTHVELLPIMEHPFYGSWGYQTIGYFAPSSRYGNPQEFMHLIEMLHENDIGVILDWVPSHFPSDEYGLVYFDGTNLYEYDDPRKRIHPDWNSYIFDYNKPEVRSFLISSAMFWCDKYHVDGLRVDAVASMLYLDYSRKEGQWVPNVHGGKENLEAISFLKQLNEAIFAAFPQAHMIAEESTAWPKVSKPTFLGGLGFNLKWNMGWSSDTQYYFSTDPLYRKYNHNNITFSIWYAFSENYILPLSHDEVVYGKKSLVNKMPGDDWQKFANLRVLFGYMYSHPGKKLLFMGNEFAQYNEWYHEKGLDWHLMNNEFNAGVSKLVRDLNDTYRKESALHELDFEQEGFEWIDFHDLEQSIISFLRKNRKGDSIVIVCNFTPVPRYNYRIGVPDEQEWVEIINTNAQEYGGNGLGNYGRVYADKIPMHNREFSLNLTLPPLSVIYLKTKEKRKDTITYALTDKVTDKVTK